VRHDWRRGVFGRIVLAALVVMLTLPATGCGGIRNPFKKIKQPLPGERISVLPDQTLKAEAHAPPVSLPREILNASWSQPGGDASNSLNNLSFSASPHQLWSVSIGKGSSKYTRLSAAPIVVGDRVFAMDAGGHIAAISTAGGAKIWDVSVVPRGEATREGFGGGLAEDAGHLYATTGYGTVLALNPNSGAILWTKDMGGPIRSSPTAAGGKVFFVSADSQLHCLDGNTGNELWTMHGLPEPAALLSNVSPAIGSRIVVAAFPAGDLGAFQLTDGKTKWTESLAANDETTAAGILADPSRPVIDGGIVYAVSHGGRMIANSESTGTRLWTKDIASTQMPWPAGSSVFVVDTNGQLLALSRRNGGVQWVSQLPSSTGWSGPVLAGGRLWLASGEGMLVGADPRSGQVVTKLNLGAPIFIAPVVAGGRMYILTDDAQLIALG
jgi:outer membrane protein assembly factor BamB